MAPEVSRRAFLLASAGMAVAAACRNRGSDIEVDGKGSSGSGGGSLSLVVASYIHVAGLDQRVALAVIQGDEPVRPDSPLQVRFKAPDGTLGPVVPGEVRGDGVPMPYVPVRHRFAVPGVHEAQVVHQGRTLTAAVDVKEAASVAVPVEGKPLMRVPTPTTADPRGVEPICTRDPACPLHDVSLDAALDEKRPVAVLFATPARCKSRFCGPVLDNLLAQHEAFRDRVRFVHVDIYKSAQSDALAPAVEAYKLPGEPFLFLADASGVVRARLDNIFDRGEVRAALEALAAGR